MMRPQRLMRRFSVIRVAVLLLVAGIGVGCASQAVTLDATQPTAVGNAATATTTRSTIQPAATRTPLPSVTPTGPSPATGLASPVVPASTAAPSMQAGLTAQPSATSALVALASVTVDPRITPSITPTPVSIQPGSPPPFAIGLPAAWKTTNTLIPVNDLSGSGIMNLAAYAGPLANGTATGFIFAFWNFPTALPISMQALPTSVQDAQEKAAVSDGYRILRSYLLDESCAVNIYGRNYFPVGDLRGTGQIFQTSGCQDNRPDLVGWYSGVWVGGRQFLFFAYVEPASGFNNAQGGLQSVLNTIRFAEVLPTLPGATATPLLAAKASPVPLTAPPALTPTTAPVTNPSRLPATATPENN